MGRNYHQSKFAKEYYSLSESKKKNVLSLIKKYRLTSEITLADIVIDVNETTGFSWTSRNLGDLIRTLGLPKKDRKLSYNARQKSHRGTIEDRTKKEVKSFISQLKSRGYSIDDFAASYDNDTFANIEDKYGISPHQAKKVANQLDLSRSKTIYSYKNLWDDLQDNGVTKEELSMIYTTYNYTFDNTKAWIEMKISKEIGYKSIVTLLKHLDIKKTDAQIKELQGRKSRAEKEDNLIYFEELVGCSIEELAERYENDRSLTKQSLLQEINENVEPGDKLITAKWLGKAIDPLLSLPRLGIVSRQEIELYEYVKNIIGEDTHVLASDRMTIAPKELDIVIPSDNTAIEFNGEYWHSNDMLLKSSLMTSFDYHSQKRKLCKEKGICLLFVWEDDWKNNREAVNEALKSYFSTGKINPILEKLTND